MRSHIYNNPADDPEAEPFLKAIVAAPGDGLPRHIFSDWLDENGYDNAARGQRWAAKYKKLPFVAENDDERRGLFSKDFSGWFPLGGRQFTHNPADKGVGSPFPSYARLPHAFLGAPDRGVSWWRPHPNPHDATGHERLFLTRTHELNWHPETGEPLG